MKRGFTIVEILAVLVIVGILAGLAYVRLQTSKDKATVATMTSDLRAISEEQEAFYFINRVYTTDLIVLNARPSPGNVLTIHEATASGWSGSVTNPKVSQQCYIVVGSATAVGSATPDAGISCS